jgi:hypothetical protein
LSSLSSLNRGISKNNVHIEIPRFWDYNYLKMKNIDHLLVSSLTERNF